MLGQTVAAALLVAAACIPASAAHTAYDRAASMAAGETALGRGYDGVNAAGTVKASVSGVSSNGGLVAPGSVRSSLTAALNSSSVPSPARRIGFGTAGAAVGAVAGGSPGRPIGAVLGAMLGFGIALMLSKLLS